MTPGTNASAKMTTALPTARAGILDAIQREEIAAIPAAFQQYRDLLEATAHRYASEPVTLSRLEADHAHFEEQLRTRLLTFRFAIQKDLERLRIAKRYNGASGNRQNIDLEG